MRIRSMVLAVVSVPAALGLACGGGSGGTDGGPPAGHAVSGTIYGASAPGAASGVTVAISGGGAGATDGAGSYTIDAVAAGTWTVTPTRSGYQFSPASRSVPVSTADVTGVDFSVAATGATLTIDRPQPASTTVTIGGAPVAMIVDVTNWTSTTAPGLAIQCLIKQGTAQRAAGGYAITTECHGGAQGALPPGSCAVHAGVTASNTTSGSATLQPGSATLIVQLLQNISTVLQSVELPITLQ